MRRLFDWTCLFLVVLFSYTAIDKFFHHDLMASVLKKTGFNPFFATFISGLVPFLEILCVVLLLVQKTVVEGLKLGLMLMLVFSGYIIYMLAASSHLPCSCGGIMSWLSWKQHLVFNIFIVAVITLALIKQPRHISQTNHR